MAGPADAVEPIVAAHCSSCGRLRTECPGCRRSFDPPRFCEQCGTRLAVLVKPTGWRGRCKVHGEVAASG